MRSVVIAAGICLSMIGSCFAQASTAPVTRVETHIPPQALESALKRFEKLEHIQVLYLAAAVDNVRTNGASGHLTADETLTRLLSGTGLKYRYVGARAVSIIPSSPPVAAARHAPTSVNQLPARLSDPLNKKAVHASRSKDPPPNIPRIQGKADKHGTSALSEVVITGSRLRLSPEELPQEVKIYDRRQLSQSGKTSVADFLDTLPTFPVVSDAQNFGIESTVSLRGLPIGTTLVLLDGRRLENGGLTAGTFFDLNNIPLAAVQRIEVVENGASAIYGSDAIGGVVNIITKKHFNGLSVSAKYGRASDYHDVHTNIVWGKELRRAGVEIIGSYETNTALTNTKRLLSASNNYTSYGGPDSNYPMCFPGNVFSRNGTPLPGAPAGSAATFAAVTGSATVGKPGFSQFSYGTLNECPILNGFEILPSNRRASLLAEAHFDVTPAVQLFAELLYTHLAQRQISRYASLFGTAAFQQYTVPASNPYNPFGTTVGVTELFPQLPITSEIETNFLRPLIGIKGTLLHRWQWEATAWLSQDQSDQLETNIGANVAAIRGALNSSNPETALNPFVAGPVASPTVLGTLFYNEDAKWRGRDESAEAFIRGPIFRLPAGDLRVVVGADYVRSGLYSDVIKNTTAGVQLLTNDSRRYDSLFAEANVPIVGALRQSASGDFLDVTLSARRDHYSDFGTDNTGQLGVVLRPVAPLLIRGTYGSAFAAPTLNQLYMPQSNTMAFIRDPITGATESVPLLIGGNPHLRPLSGRFHTTGVVYSGGEVNRLVLSATQWEVVENNAIQSLLPQVVVNNATILPGRVIRNSAGQIVSIDDTQINFGSFNVAGIDYEADYQHPVGAGAVSIALNATETYHYEQQLAPGGLPLEVAGKAQDDGDWAPRWKGTVGIDWMQNSLETHLQGRYTGTYQDYDSLRKIGNFWTFDVNVRWQIGREVGLHDKWLGRSYLEVGATNLFNRAPQFSNFENDFFGYDAAQMSALGRMTYLEVGSGW